MAASSKRYVSTVFYPGVGDTYLRKNGYPPKRCVRTRVRAGYAVSGYAEKHCCLIHFNNKLNWFTVILLSNDGIAVQQTCMRFRSRRFRSISEFQHHSAAAFGVHFSIPAFPAPQHFSISSTTAPQHFQHHSISAPHFHCSISALI